MPEYKCKKCKTKNPILQEWIDLGVSRIVTCISCGHKMNLNLGGKNIQAPSGTQVVATAQEHKHNLENIQGTNVVGLSGTTAISYALQIIKGPQSNESLKIETQSDNYSIYFGRNPKDKKTDIDTQTDLIWIINDPYVSRLHGVIQVQISANKVQFVLEDHSSSNGTSINNTLLESGDRIILNIEDHVEVGDTIFVLKKKN